jgi:hypothetical protein
MARWKNGMSATSAGAVAELEQIVRPWLSATDNES